MSLETFITQHVFWANGSVGKKRGGVTRFFGFSFSLNSESAAGRSTSYALRLSFQGRKVPGTVMKVAAGPAPGERRGGKHMNHIA